MGSDFQSGSIAAIPGVVVMVDICELEYRDVGIVGAAITSTVPNWRDGRRHRRAARRTISDDERHGPLDVW